MESKYVVQYQLYRCKTGRALSEAPNAFAPNARASVIDKFQPITL